MPVGEAQADFARAAARDGIYLEVARVPWINQRGHFALPSIAESIASPVLDTIFHALGGEVAAQLGKRATPLTGDFFHPGTGTFIETDETQHFTSYRLQTLELYPPGVPLGFEADHYKHLCHLWARTADRYFAKKDATGFGVAGRQRQRAYNDALRDLAIPAMGHPPLVRVPILDNEGAAAYVQHRETLQRALSS